MKYTLLLKPITYIVFWCISVIWVFFLGFSLGQNEAPETLLPFLSPTIKEDTQEQESFSPVTENELTYSTILQKSSTPIVVPNDANVVEKDKKTIGEGLPKEGVQNIIQNTKPTQDQKYKFSLQLLAVKQKKSAEEYRNKLKENNITTDVVEVSKNDISWYRIYTTFTGTISQFNAFKDTLASLGIVDTILRERIPQ